jgi:putative spermidine/putrescine transport system permease protein
VGEDQIDALEDLSDVWEDEAFWYTLMSGAEGAEKATGLLTTARAAFGADL